MSAQIMFGLPVWALMSSVGITHFPVNFDIEELTIFADHDEAGFAAAKVCAQRYAAVGIAGQINHPPKPGDDWNDHLKAMESNHGK